jgi:hypothetical protein
MQTPVPYLHDSWQGADAAFRFCFLPVIDAKCYEFRSLDLGAVAAVVTMLLAEPVVGR